MTEANGQPRASLGKKLAIGCVVIIVAAFVFVVALVLHIGWKAQNAEEQVRAICADYRAGSSAAGFEADALTRGLSVQRSDDHDPITEERAEILTARDGVFLSVWSCTIEVRADRVVDTRIEFDD